MARAFLMLALVTALAACREPEPRFSGPHLYVLFDERHALAGGEPVRLHEFTIGEVEAIDLESARVRAKLRLRPDILEQLTEATTFSVESDAGGELFLKAHVLDPDARPLEEGEVVEGVDSSLELVVRRARAGARSLFGLEELERELEGVDWKEKREEIRKRWDDVVRKMNELADQTAEEARQSYEAIEEAVRRLLEELEAAGRSEEVAKLRERLEKFLQDLGEK